MLYVLDIDRQYAPEAGIAILSPDDIGGREMSFINKSPDSQYLPAKVIVSLDSLFILFTTTASYFEPYRAGLILENPTKNRN